MRVFRHVKLNYKFNNICDFSSLSADLECHVSNTRNSIDTNAPTEISNDEERTSSEIGERPLSTGCWFVTMESQNPTSSPLPPRSIPDGQDTNSGPLGQGVDERPPSTASRDVR